jgi:hypothetical protein
MPRKKSSGVSPALKIRHEGESEVTMKPWKRVILTALVVLTILSLLLTACEPRDNFHGKPDNGKDKDKHKDKDTDKDDDNEQDQVEAGNPDKITICHRTGSPKKPYVQISVSRNAVQDGHGHGSHEGDLIPAPEGGCPTTVVATDVPAR